MTVMFARVACLALLWIGCVDDYTEDDFRATTAAEEEAKERIQYWVQQAETLLADSRVPSDRQRSLQRAIENTRNALSHYDDVRSRGQNRTFIIAPITTSAGAIVADDATVIGVADDVLLIPLALAAIATYAITDSYASQEELIGAWNTTLARVRDLAVEVEDIVHLTASGHVADTGIMQEVAAIIQAGKATSVCGALALLLEEVKNARDKQGKLRKARIQTTQKFHQCRRSRRSRE
ncbi:polymorphic toxin type 34 domain-containing protein [Haliangium sp.]|uniref:polymorphic toxin type 34 domain-containing protein n=1 Tax=Haliangium sp. TaxID=2663208 RepID=UPI003D0C584E